MRVRLAMAMAVAASAVSLLAGGGCSGSGVPGVPRQASALQTAAQDHLSTVLLVKRWFAILYEQTPTGSRESKTCEPGWQPLPPRPNDPPGSARYRGTMSDCTVIDLLLLADGSGHEVFRYPTGQTKSVRWGAPVYESGWKKWSMSETTADGTRLLYERGLDLSAHDAAQYEKGTATLASGKAMDFDHQRNDDRDSLTLRLYDGSRLSLYVPLIHVAFRPRFSPGATGSFEAPGDASQQFHLWGPAGGGWQQWDLTTDAGLTGLFTLGAGMAGTGLLKQDGQVAGALRWDDAVDGTLEPVGAGAIDVVPSAAAWAFRVDAWVGNIAAMGPMPSW